MLLERLRAVPDALHAAGVTALATAPIVERSVVHDHAGHFTRRIRVYVNASEAGSDPHAFGCAQGGRFCS